MIHSARTDEELIAAACEGSRDAFEQLSERYRGRLVRYIDMASGGAADSESIVQESLMRAYVFRHSYRRDAGFVTWLYAIARNEMAREFKKNRPTLPECHVASDSFEIDDVLIKNERLRKIRIALNELPRLQRETIILFRFGGLSCAETAKTLGTSEGAVRTAIYKGLKSLRKRLIDHEENEL